MPEVLLIFLLLHRRPNASPERARPGYIAALR